MADILTKVSEALATTIIGQHEIIKKLVIAFISDGHTLIEGVPGLAKTQIVKSISQCFNCSFKRIQFTPDLLPSDIIGTMIFDPKKLAFDPAFGPIFNNIILADEINRSPAKVQSALLQAMAENEVNLGGDNYPISLPFYVVATQNPIEHEGTYPLPEAQLDRFMFKIIINYPTIIEEFSILANLKKIETVAITPIISLDELKEIKKEIETVFVDEKLIQYICDIVHATRKQSAYGLYHLEKYIQWGASPRASIYAYKAAKSHAYLDKRDYIIPDDIHFVIKDILRHRILLSYEALAENLSADKIVDDILQAINIP